MSSRQDDCNDTFEGIAPIDTDLDRLHHVGFELVHQEVRRTSWAVAISGHANVRINDAGERVLVLDLSVDYVVAYIYK